MSIGSNFADVTRRIAEIQALLGVEQSGPAAAVPSAPSGSADSFAQALAAAISPAASATPSLSAPMTVPPGYGLVPLSTLGFRAGLQPVAAPVPAASSGGAGLEQVTGAIARANGGGGPVSILQLGDSHVVEGTEARTIEALFEGVAPVEYRTQAKVGASASHATANPAEWLDGPIAAGRPDLVILSFGSNDAAATQDPATYSRAYQHLVDEVRRRAPDASILVVGPSDGNQISGAAGSDLPGLQTVIDVQKQIAARNGLDFLDLRAAMGGPGSIERWQAQGLAGPDGLHFTAQGYQRIGQSIFDHLRAGLAS